MKEALAALDISGTQVPVRAWADSLWLLDDGDRSVMALLYACRPHGYFPEVLNVVPLVFIDRDILARLLFPIAWPDCCSR